MRQNLEKVIQALVITLTSIVVASLFITIFDISFPQVNLPSTSFLPGLSATFLAFLLLYLFISIRQEMRMRNEELKWQLEKIDKKHYSMISGKEKEFGIELSDNLPYIPRDNIKEAKVALEANAPTAAAMVALRAAEYSILDWYEFKTGEEPRTISWYHLIKELEENSDLEVDEEVISKVYYLRETRNKIMHAEKDVSSSEARRIISDIIDLIDYIYSNMGEVRGGTR